MITETKEEYIESQIDAICREYKKPNLTVWQIAEVFGNEEAIPLVKKRINILTRERNKLMKKQFIIDLDLRYIINSLNEYKASLIEKEIKSQKLLLKAVQMKVDADNGVVPSVESKQGVNDIDILRAREYPIKELMESYGVEFKRDFASCPFHIEDTASMHYIKDRNTVHCHGGCSRSYDTIDIVRHFNNCGFIEAVRKLAT